MEIIARIHTDFKEKFGIPRQSGLVDDLEGTVVFEPAYRNPDALRGIEEFSHIWLLWQFSENVRAEWSPTVRPPRLGGNTRMGVFATRSPFRPNPVGMSCVRLKRVEKSAEHGTVLVVAGADLMDETPIYDIKPYIPSADCHPDARGGFSEKNTDYRLLVKIPDRLCAGIPEDKRRALAGILSEDPRPAYQRDPARSYGLSFAGFEIRFHVEDEILYVDEVADERD